MIGTKPLKGLCAHSLQTGSQTSSAPADPTQVDFGYIPLSAFYFSPPYPTYYPLVQKWCFPYLSTLTPRDKRFPPHSWGPSVLPIAPCRTRTESLLCMTSPTAILIGKNTASRPPSPPGPGKHPSLLAAHGPHRAPAACQSDGSAPR